MRAYSMDLRERVVAACDEGLDTRAEVAERFSVSESWVRRLLQRRRETGSMAPKCHGGGQRPAFDSESLERLRQAVAERPDATLAELRDAVGVTCGITAVHGATVALGLTHKKTTIRNRARMSAPARVTSCLVYPSDESPCRGRSARCHTTGPRILTLPCGSSTSSIASARPVDG